VPPGGSSSSMSRDGTPVLDADRILAVLDRHQVDFLVVGGVAAIAHGATRPTSDLDCVARRSGTNLDRLAAALRELNARLRVAGLSDEEAAALPTQLDRDTLGRMNISTWRTELETSMCSSTSPTAPAAGCASTN
jgi:hypothetical protein